jgi:Ser/Thr protein kinase RdoA (MazF antagonist)
LRPPIVSFVEERLSGGNTHEQIIRVGSTVRRPIGPWTPGVHALLSHLEQAGYSGAPRVHGVDELGREVLDYIEGEVVHPQHRYLIDPDEALAQVAITIRRFHDAVSGFAGAERFAWSDRGSDPSGASEILCHNDLAPWNLIRSTQDRWVFIDWDFAAPGRRSWDISFALLSLVPLMPTDAPNETRVAERLAVFATAYGTDDLPADVLSVAVERCEREAQLIFSLGEAGEPPYDRLFREGHGEIWRSAATHVAARTPTWQPALRIRGHS